MGNIRHPLLDNTDLHMFTISVQPSEHEVYILTIHKVTSQHTSKDSNGSFDSFARCLPIQVSWKICLCVFLNDWCQGSLVTSVVTRSICKKGKWLSTSVFLHQFSSSEQLGGSVATYKTAFPKTPAGNLWATEARCLLLCCLLPLHHRWEVYIHH